ncbi:MAG TPA: hypothetical protein VFN38_09960 [Gemmatimonadaceae bacterium]|nr:hypothetical protein [Gemmatimonadaceae bacterium]
MEPLALSPTQYRIVIGTLITAAAVGVVVFLSFAQGLFYALFADVASRAQAFREGVLGRSDRFLTERLAAFWTARESEPRAPMVSELSRLSGAIESVGEAQVHAIVDAERRIGMHLNALRSIQQPEGADATTDRERLIESVGGTSLFSLGFLVLFTVAIGAVNSFLLAIFFREVIGSYRVLPYPMPDLQASNLIALIIFVAEVTTGWAIYRSGDHQKAGERKTAAGAGFFAVIPWVMLAVLAIVELAAYSTLSLRVNLAQRLRLDAAGPVYPLAQYFLAFLGIGLTLLLAYLGHAIAEGIAERRRSKLAREIIASLRKGKSNALAQVTQLRLPIERIRETATSFPTSISDDFIRQLGIVERRAPVLHVVEQFAVGVLAPLDRSATSAAAPADAPPSYLRMARTRSQVWGDLILSAMLAVALLLAATLTASEVVSLLREVGTSSTTSHLIAWSAGIGVPLVLIGLGAVGWNLARGLRYANPAAAALPERRGQAILWWAVVSATISATVALVAVALAVTYGRLPFLFGALAVLQAGALVCFAAFLDRGAVAILHLLYLAWLVATRVGALLLAAVASLAELLCFVLRIVVRLFAIPGDVLRGRMMEAKTWSVS